MVKSLIGSVEAFYYKWRKTYGLVDVIICPSEFMKRQLDTDPVLAKKTVMMHNFMPKADVHKMNRSDEDDMWTQLEAKLPEHYVLYFGRFTREKGVETLLNVCKELPQISFVFAGTGELADEIDKLPNVQNVGFISGAALQRLIEKAEFSVYPSQWYENCPFSVMESQIYGTPVIASDIGGIPELIEDGYTGELFESADKAQLEEKIKRLWTQPELCLKYRENCKNIKFDTTLEYCGKIVNDIYL